MGGPMQQALSFIPGALMTAGGAYTGNPALMAGGMSSMAGSGAGLVDKQSPQQQLQTAFANNPSLSALNNLPHNGVEGIAPGSPPLAPSSVANWGNIADMAMPLIGLGTEGIGKLMGGGQPPQQPSPMARPPMQGAPPPAPPMPVGAAPASPMNALAQYQQFLGTLG